MPQPEGRLPQVVKKKEGHMPELRKRRSHLALLGVFAMVASVLAVGAPSAMAEPGKADAAATYSACVGPAAADAGFTDVAAGSTHDAAVNCIAYYGITRGTSATTFAPNQTISRWQLAVMLQRAAGPAGVTLPTAGNQGFTDISELNSSFQDAINQMAELGVMAGITPTTFNPSGIVSRGTIVEALAGFLTSARVGPGGKVLSRELNSTLTVKDGVGSNAQAIPLDESFRDIGAVTFSVNQAIRALAEMGVAEGRGDGTFGPAASVTRAQAAAFITRALAHTNARPAGLTMQVAKTEVTDDEDFSLSISVRGNDFAPADSAAVDVFSHRARDASTAFRADGTCNTQTGGVSAKGIGLGACVVQLDDDVTDANGNVSVEPGTISENTVFWAWSGDTGDRLDWDSENLSRDSSVASLADSVTMTTVTSPTSARVTTSVSGDAENKNTVRYGTTVTVTVQLFDENGKEIGVAGQSYSWWAQGEHEPTGPSRRIQGTGTRTITTDANGKATFTLTAADPDTIPTPTGGTNPPDQDPAANDKTTWTYNIAKASPTGVDVVANDAIGFAVSGSTGTGSIVFDDDSGRATTVTITPRRSWTPAPAIGQTAHVGVTGKVTDQYGNPLPRYPMFFDVDGDATFGCEVNTDPCVAEYTIAGGTSGMVRQTGTVAGTTRRVTSSNGTRSINAPYVAGVDKPTYRVAAALTEDTEVNDPGEQAMVRHYWTQGPFGYNPDTGIGTPTDGTAKILIVDTATNTIVRDDRWYMCDSTPADGCSGTLDRVENGFNITPSDPDDFPAIARAYDYTDTTRFTWWVNGAPNTVRWLTPDEFEARWAKHLTARRMANPLADVGAQLGIRQYSTKSGFTVLDIRLDTGSDIQDPASP